ncbi:OLC1v1001110C1 [Oldenlandia corymbosa var. corymbosa]|uniref:OLC1v1001110C1 n=1 Tax=Oldenlandia corymbosa var. corymbosa TaxID=529605 RepID=A0AAV1D7B8_OLDCO|nr:OLC1v1001110C1 [Oldenlandia corymbosa var. corymbosa]
MVRPSVVTSGSSFSKGELSSSSKNKMKLSMVIGSGPSPVRSISSLPSNLKGGVFIIDLRTKMASQPWTSARQQIQHDSSSNMAAAPARQQMLRLQLRRHSSRHLPS